MTMKNVRIFSGAVLALLALYILISIPGIIRKDRAQSFAQFAANGVSVRETGRTIAGSYNPILVPTGMGLLLSQEFEFTNASGEKRMVMFCNGHPDYWKLEQAVALEQRHQRGYRMNVILLTSALKDEHYDDNHLGFQRFVRFQEIRGVAR